MAATQQQILDWAAANPNAGAQQWADVMKATGTSIQDVAAATGRDANELVNWSTSNGLNAKDLQQQGLLTIAAPTWQAPDPATAAAPQNGNGLIQDVTQSQIQNYAANTGQTDNYVTAPDYALAPGLQDYGGAASNGLSMYQDTGNIYATNNGVSLTPVNTTGSQSPDWFLNQGLLNSTPTTTTAPPPTTTAPPPTTTTAPPPTTTTAPPPTTTAPPPTGTQPPPPKINVDPVIQTPTGSSATSITAPPPPPPVDNTLRNGASEAETSGGRPIDAPVGDTYKPDLKSAVDYNTETIEGRMQGLLGMDANGKFNTPAVQQAANAARSLFARRGLLNSSMAQEAVMEAAISKAIEIAGPDADKYFQNRRGNVDWTNKYGQQYLEQAYGLQNKAVTQDYTLERDAVQQGYTQDNMNLDNTLKKDILGVQHGYAKDLATLQHGFNTQDMTLQDTFNRGMATLQNTLSNGNFDKEQSAALQANYISALGRIDTNRTAEITDIQNSDLTAAEKNAAIASANLKYANSANIMTGVFEKMPGWVKTWSVAFDEKKLSGDVATAAAAVEAQPKADTKTTPAAFDVKTVADITDLNAVPTPEQEARIKAAIAAGYTLGEDGKWVKKP